MSEEKESTIVDIGNETIDISKVVRVGDLGGDPSWLRYTVWFDGGHKMEVFQERRVDAYMRRTDFIRLWRQANLISKPGT